MFTTDIVRQGLIQRSVGNNLENDGQDVLAVKDGLSRAGFFSFEDNPTEPHGIITRQMDDGIKSFQKAKGLRVDGWLYPKGETERALVQEVSTGFKGANTDVILPESRDVMKPKKSDNKSSCSGLEVAWINAEAALFVAKQKFAKAESRLINLEKQLIDLRSLSKKEKSYIRGDRGKARYAGGATGLVLGGLIGGPVGAALGAGVGSNLGPIVEEGMDVVTGEKIDIQIDLEILNISKRIAEIRENIDNVLKPNLSLATDKAENAKLKLIDCSRK